MWGVPSQGSHNSGCYILGVEYNQAIAIALLWSGVCKTDLEPL